MYWEDLSIHPYQVIIHMNRNNELCLKDHINQKPSSYNTPAGDNPQGIPTIRPRYSFLVLFVSKTYFNLLFCEVEDIFFPSQLSSYILKYIFYYLQPPYLISCCSYPCPFIYLPIKMAWFMVGRVMLCYFLWPFSFWG